MTERLLQFIWQFQYFNTSDLRTEQGEGLGIIYPGIYNTNQGPDFLAAKLLLDNTIWAGNIELHLNTSDWQKHGHQGDEMYRNVILHVVWENDRQPNALYCLPTLELQPRVSGLLLDKFRSIMTKSTFIPCENNIKDIAPLVLEGWKERLLIERLQRRYDHVRQLLTENNHNWEETLWWMLARNFGIKVNAEAFEEIARSVPIRILGRHKHQIHQLEALLLGQGGLLQTEFKEAYPAMLQKEYRFLQKKYKLVPVKQPLLFLRMRPPNFPSVRLAQLAMLLHCSGHLFSRIKEMTLLKEVVKMFQVTANDYWHYHYRLGVPAQFKPKSLGSEMVYNIIINAIIPVLYSYGTYHSIEGLVERSLQWMREIPGERNVVAAEWKKTGLKTEHACDSQALLELKSMYCDKKRCLDCAIGNIILKG